MPLPTIPGRYQAQFAHAAAAISGLLRAAAADDPSTDPGHDEPVENEPVENEPVENEPVENEPVENEPDDVVADGLAADEDETTPLADAVCIACSLARTAWFEHVSTGAPDRPAEPGSLLEALHPAEERVASVALINLAAQAVATVELDIESVRVPYDQLTNPDDPDASELAVACLSVRDLPELAPPPADPAPDSSLWPPSAPELAAAGRVVTAEVALAYALNVGIDADSATAFVQCVKLLTRNVPLDARGKLADPAALDLHAAAVRAHDSIVAARAHPDGLTLLLGLIGDWDGDLDMLDATIANFEPAST